MPLQYAQIKGVDGLTILQRLDRLSAAQQATVLNSPDLQRVAECDEHGSTVEDAQTGKQRKNGQDQAGPSLLAKWKSNLPKLKLPNPPKGGGNQGA